MFVTLSLDGSSRSRSVEILSRVLVSPLFAVFNRTSWSRSVRNSSRVLDSLLVAFCSWGRSMENMSAELVNSSLVTIDCSSWSRSSENLSDSRSRSVEILSRVLAACNNNISFSESLTVRPSYDALAVSSPLPSAPKAPEKDSEFYPQWKRCNALITLWILRSVTTTIASSVLSLYVASEIWEDLKWRFSERDAIRISDLLEEIYSLKQGSSTVTEYYTQLKMWWNELLFLRPLPECECNPSCQCDAIAKAKEYLQNDQVIRFLKGSNDNFSMLRSHIMLMEPLLEMDTAFEMIIREKLAELYEYEQQWSKAVQMFSDIDLESGMRVVDDNFRLSKCVLIARLYLEDDDAVNVEAKFEVGITDVDGLDAIKEFSIIVFFLTRGLVLFFGYAYSAYECFKTVELGAFCDKLTLEEVKKVASLNDVSLKEILGTLLVNGLSMSICKAMVWTIPSVYVKASSALLEIIQAKPCRLCNETIL